MKFKVEINTYPFQDGTQIQDAPPIPNSTRKATLDTDIGIGRSVYINYFLARKREQVEVDITVDEFREALNKLLMEIEGKLPKERYPQVTTIELVG